MSISLIKMDRFKDKNYRLSDFAKKVLVVCPRCTKQARALVDYEENIARLYCFSCGYSKECSTKYGKGYIHLPANAYFGAELWLKERFRDNWIWAYNYEHLNYLEQYISAGLRERQNRTHFTMVEKLPSFIQSAKNRDALIKLIGKMKA